MIMRDILKLAFGGGCEVVLPKLDTNQVLSRAGGLDHYDDDDDDDQDGDENHNDDDEYDDDLTSLIVCVGSTSTSLGAVSMLSEISVLIAIRI